MVFKVPHTPIYGSLENAFIVGTTSQDSVFNVDTRDPGTFSGTWRCAQVLPNGRDFAGRSGETTFFRSVGRVISGTQSGAVQGCQFQAVLLNDAICSANMFGGQFAIIQSSTGAMSGQALGFRSVVSVGTGFSGGTYGTITEATCFEAQIRFDDASATCAITEAQAIKIINPRNNTANATIGTNHGILIEDMTGTGITTAYAIKTEGGRVEFDGDVTLEEQSATPSDPADGAEVRVYMKADKFILQYNQAGTVRYKYLDLTGTGVTWVHTTTAP